MHQHRPLTAGSNQSTTKTNNDFINEEPGDQVSQLPSSARQMSSTISLTTLYQTPEITPSIMAMNATQPLRRSQLFEQGWIGLYLDWIGLDWIGLMTFDFPFYFLCQMSMRQKGEY